MINRLLKMLIAQGSKYGTRAAVEKMYDTDKPMTREEKIAMKKTQRRAAQSMRILRRLGRF